MLFLLDTWAPAILRVLPEFEKDALLLSVIAKEIAMRSGNTEFEVSATEVEQLKGDAQLTYVLDQMKKAGVVAQDLPEEIALSYGRQLMKGIRTRGAAWRNYRPSV